MTTMKKIRRIRITQYMGVAELDARISPSGAIAAGGNSRGKSSLLKAVTSALGAQGIGPDAIRHGADRAELLVDLEDVSVRRVITAKGSTLTVTRDGMKANAPQKFLDQLLGTSALDVVGLILEKDKKKRRAQILAALPVSVTQEQISAWTGETYYKPVDGHGLEVVARVRASYYDARTDANKSAEAAEREADRLATQAAALPDPGETFSEAHAQERLDVARRGAAALDAKAAEAKAARERGATTRHRIAELRANARELYSTSADTSADPTELGERARLVAQCEQAVRDISQQLDDARATLATALENLRMAEARERDSKASCERAKAEDARADELEATLASLEVPDVTAQERLTASAHVNNAIEALGDAQSAERVRLAHASRDVADVAAKRARAEASRLDAIVKRLTDAPGELLAASNAIPGLALDTDDIAVDGVKLDSLSGAEQLRFCVEIARRANAKSGILVVDGLERLDGDQIDDFVRHAVRGGFQLLASKVTRGEMVLEAIEIEEAQAAQ